MSGVFSHCALSHNTVIRMPSSLLLAVYLLISFSPITQVQLQVLHLYSKPLMHIRDILNHRLATGESWRSTKYSIQAKKSTFSEASWIPYKEANPTVFFFMICSVFWWWKFFNNNNSLYLYSVWQFWKYFQIYLFIWSKIEQSEGSEACIYHHFTSKKNE